MSKLYGICAALEWKALALRHLCSNCRLKGCFVGPPVRRFGSRQTPRGGSSLPPLISRSHLRCAGRPGRCGCCPPSGAGICRGRKRGPGGPRHPQKGCGRREEVACASYAVADILAIVSAKVIVIAPGNGECAGDSSAGSEDGGSLTTLQISGEARMLRLRRSISTPMRLAANWGSDQPGPLRGQPTSLRPTKLLRQQSSSKLIGSCSWREWSSDPRLPLRQSHRHS